MSEQLEAQLAGMGSGALSEVGGPFGMKASWAFMFLVVYKCDLGSTETSGVILHKVYNGFFH